MASLLLVSLTSMGDNPAFQPLLYHALLFPSTAAFSTPTSAFPLAILPLKQPHNTAAFIRAGKPWRPALVAELSL